MTLHLEALAFGNGVAVSPDQASVLVAETGHGAIRRLWINGPQTAAHSYFAEAMASFPDNLSVTPEGHLLVAQVTRFTDDLRRIHALPFPLAGF